jgi:hypothetical protein
MKPDKKLGDILWEESDVTKTPIQTPTDSFLLRNPESGVESSLPPTPPSTSYDKVSGV